MPLVPRFCIAALIAAASAGSAPAQQHGQEHGGHQPSAAAPYAGLEARPLKALSEQQIADLRAGRGMGLALAAELNGYPGPVHVIEHADQLELADSQRTGIQELYAAMKAEAIPLGEAIIAAEIKLDRAFGASTVTPASLRASTAEIARLQGELRAAHLNYHLKTVELLSPAQIRGYNELRGYSGREGATAPPADR